MDKSAIKGKRYKLIKDFKQFEKFSSIETLEFKKGDIVISLENDYYPYCVLEEYYNGSCNVNDYDYKYLRPIYVEMLEEIYDDIKIDFTSIEREIIIDKLLGIIYRIENRRGGIDIPERYGKYDKIDKKLLDKIDYYNNLKYKMYKNVDIFTIDEVKTLYNISMYITVDRITKDDLCIDLYNKILSVMEKEGIV